MSETRESSYPSRQDPPVIELALEPGYAYGVSWFFLIASCIPIVAPLLFAGIFVFGIVQAISSVVALLAAVFIIHLRSPRILRIGDEGVTFGKKNGRKRTICWDSMKEVRWGKKHEINRVYVPSMGYDIKIVGSRWRNRIYVEFSLYSVKGASVTDFISGLLDEARERGISVVKMVHGIWYVRSYVDELES